MHAEYDKNGDIILSGLKENTSRKATPNKESTQQKKQPSVWNVVEDQPRTAPTSTESMHKAPRQVRTKTRTRSSDNKEVIRQLRSTSAGIRKSLRSLRTEIGALPTKTLLILKKILKAAATPVIPKKKTTKKVRTKGQLFFIDTLRFGGTFAAIFGVLFVSMNAHSFWEIARAQLALGIDTETTEALEHLATRHSFIDGPVRTDALYTAANMVRYLDPVGPEEDRLVIPKLGKNVPIVRPSMQSLMKQDWKGFEDDIQVALQDGIVHYPGSARPGQAGNFFLTGHSSYYAWAEGDYKEVFARLHELDIGDTYFVYHNGDKHMYRISEKYEVKPTDVSVLDQPTDKRLSTLMTCTPVGTTLRRLIVKAEEIDPITGEVLAVGERRPASDTASIFTGISALPI